MYPQVLLTLVALWRKDFRIMPYLVVMSIVGALLAGYHYLGQININTSLPCSAIGFSAACSESFFLRYGYITIPMMALTAFVLIIVLFFIFKKNKFN